MCPHLSFPPLGERFGNCFRTGVGGRVILTGDKNTDFGETVEIVNGFLCKASILLGN
jgi:hypothetical protein